MAQKGMPSSAARLPGLPKSCQEWEGREQHEPARQQSRITNQCVINPIQWSLQVCRHCKSSVQKLAHRTRLLAPQGWPSPRTCTSTTLLSKNVSCCCCPCSAAAAVAANEAGWACGRGEGQPGERMNVRKSGLTQPNKRQNPALRTSLVRLTRKECSPLRCTRAQHHRC